MATIIYDPVKFLALQERCVREHKWFMGQREDHAIDDNDAWREWITIHFADKYRTAYEANLNRITSACYEICGEKCKGVQSCEMEEDLLHRLIVLD